METIYCAFCVQVHEGTVGKAQEAITIRGGTATCIDHIGYAHDPNVTNFLVITKRK